MNNNIIKVTVLSATVDERNGTFTDDSGKERPFTTRKQKGKIEYDGYVVPYAVRLEQGQTAYSSGEYELAVDEMFQVNKEVASLSKYTRLRKLTPAASSKPA